jgi:hypothetical protein
VPPVQELPGDLDGGAQQVVGGLLGGSHAGAQVLDGPAAGEVEPQERDKPYPAQPTSVASRAQTMCHSFHGA